MKKWFEKLTRKLWKKKDLPPLHSQSNVEEREGA